MDDMRVEQALRRMGAKDGRPSRIDLEEIVRHGRHRIRLRRTVSATAIAAAVVAVLVAAPIGLHLASLRPSPAASISCVESTLPLPAGATDASLWAGDPTGRYLVGQAYPAAGAASTPATGVLWTDRQITMFRIDGLMDEITDVSSRGTVIGDAAPTTNSQQTGWVYRGGATTWLATEPGAGVHPLAINGNDVIVGTMYVDSGQAPVRWSSPTAQIEQLPMPAGYAIGDARDIDDDGTIVGQISAAAGQPSRVAIWRPGAGVDTLPFPARIPHAVTMSVLSIRDGIVTVIVAAPEYTELTGAARYYGENDTVLTYDVATGAYTVLPGAATTDLGLLPRSMTTSGSATGTYRIPNAADGTGRLIGARFGPGVSNVGEVSLYAPRTGWRDLPSDGYTMPASGPTAPPSGTPIPIGTAQVKTISNGGRVLGGNDIYGPVILPVTWACG